MKTHLHIIALLPLAALSLSCERENVPHTGPEGYHSSNVEVKAMAELPEGWIPMTKAASDITNIDDTELQSRGFGVYAFYTGTEEYSSATDSSAYRKFGLVLNNRKFEYATSTWSNSGKAEFWPASDGENLTLFAYAPWDTWNGLVQYDGKVPTIQYDNFVAQDLSVAELSKQRDLLWGTNTSGDPHKNVEKDDYDPEGTVDFHFRHAVAKVHLNVKGTLPGEVRNHISSGGESHIMEGTPTAPENGNSSFTENNPVFKVANTSEYFEPGDQESERISLGLISVTITYDVRYYHAIKEQTQTETMVQTRYRTNTQESTGAVYAVSGQRYLVEEVTLKGFNQTGTLVLDNATSYAPTWINTARFSGPAPEYVLNGSNVLTQSMQYVPAATVESNFSTYTGITETASDLMSGYFLYAIPRESTSGDRIAVTIKYHKLNVSGTLAASQSRELLQKQTRSISRTRKRSITSERKKLRKSNGSQRLGWGAEDWSTVYNNNGSKESDYTFSDSWPDWDTAEWGPWSDSEWGEWQDVSSTDWSPASETLTSAVVNYNDDNAPNLSGEIITNLEGGRVYDMNLIVAGDKIELDVVPRPWDLKEFEFDYDANENIIIQPLTYDSSFIDYADASGNIYINNRMGKFFFQLGAGKYASWQASLVGDAAFGFCDEDGNWILDEHGNRVASIRHAIDPEVMNYIYIKPINTEASVTSHAKLRIYYIDATGDAVVALNLVEMSGVTEWTIWQNAN